MPAQKKRLRVRIACMVVSVSLLAGCATGTNPRDPFESFNRGVYSFNENLDKAILKPTAEAYRAVLPQFIRSSVSNFFSNINDVVVAVNNLLQGKFTDAYTDLGRVAINSTLGVLGLFDVASEAGIEKHDEDFGQTLARWGVGEGPFIMLPLLGPSTGRDTVGRFVDHHADLVTYVDPSRSRNQLWATRTVNRRSELLDASTVLQTAALDPYEFVRDAYLQRRRSLIYDGSPPMDRDFIDPPPKPQSSIPRDPVFTAAAEPVPVISVRVSGDANAPVRSTYSAPAPISGHNEDKPQPVAHTAYGLPVLTGAPLTTTQWELLEPGQITVGGIHAPAKPELPRLTQLWKVLKLER
jgi:phospholipid-binding lipoprotein MlaA